MTLKRVIINLTQNELPVPSGYSVFRMLAWGIEPLSSQGAYSTEQQSEIGSFQVISPYIINSAGSWVRTWSAVSNFNKVSHADVMRIANFNLLDFGYPWGMSESEIIAVKDTNLPDGYSLHRKMNWLINNVNENPNAYAPMWGHGNWWQSLDVVFGTMVWGGRDVCCTNATKTFNVKLAGEATARAVTMRKLWTFKRSDFGRRITWLMPKCSAANHPGSVFAEYMRGFIYAPNALDPIDFDFAGTFQPAEYWLPVEWMVKL